jgi:hypothetical protein
MFTNFECERTFFDPSKWLLEYVYKSCMWTNIRRPLNVALRICLQTLHVNEHSSTPESGSKNMFTNLACKRTFVDPSKWLYEYVSKPCMWTNIRRPLKVALRICVQTLHVNKHSSTPQTGSKSMFTNLACERTFVDPSKWLYEYVYTPCMWTNIRRPLKVAVRICLQTLHANEHSSTPQSDSTNMLTNLACERTFVDPWKWL